MAVAAGPVPADVRAAAEAEAAALSVAYPPAEDDLQAVQRWAGHLREADRTARSWRRRDPAQPLAPLRQAEVAFLDRRWDDAADAALEAERLVVAAGLGGAGTGLDEAVPLPEGTRSLDEHALLVAGAAAAAGGRSDDALRALERAVALVRPRQESSASLVSRVLAEVQRGTVLLERGDAEGAGRRFAEAGQLSGVLGEDTDPGLSRQAAAGAALAATLTDRVAEGVEPARRAAASDPDDPLLRLDLGFVQRRAGLPVAAEQSYREALRLDPRLGLALLDLGTLLAQDGRRDAEAGDLLRRGLARQPDSAPGWHSLGVVLARGGLRDQLQSQAAFARAAREDRSFRGRDRTLVYDEKVYVTRLDLSQPLPAAWSYTAEQRRLPATALLGAAVLGLFGYYRGKVTGRVVGTVEDRAKQALETSRRLPRQLVPAVGVVATLAVLLQPVLGGPAAGGGDRRRRRRGGAPAHGRAAAAPSARGAGRHARDLDAGARAGGRGRRDRAVRLRPPAGGHRHRRRRAGAPGRTAAAVRCRPAAVRPGDGDRGPAREGARHDRAGHVSGVPDAGGALRRPVRARPADGPGGGPGRDGDRPGPRRRGAVGPDYAPSARCAVIAL